MGIMNKKVVTLPKHKTLYFNVQCDERKATKLKRDCATHVHKYGVNVIHLGQVQMGNCSDMLSARLLAVSSRCKDLRHGLTCFPIWWMFCVIS